MSFFMCCSLDMENRLTPNSQLPIPNEPQKFMLTPNFSVRGFSTDVAFSHAAPKRVVQAPPGRIVRQRLPSRQSAGK